MDSMKNREERMKNREARLNKLRQSKGMNGNVRVWGKKAAPKDFPKENCEK